MAKRYFAPLSYGSFAHETGLEFDGSKANETGWAEYQNNYEQDGVIGWFRNDEFETNFREFVIAEPDGSPFSRTVVDKP